MAFSGVNNRQTQFSKCSEQPSDGRYDLLQVFDLIAQRRAKSAWLNEIALHVDNHQPHARTRFSRRQLIWIGRCNDGVHAACPVMCRPMSARSAPDDVVS